MPCARCSYPPWRPGGLPARDRPAARPRPPCGERERSERGRTSAEAVRPSRAHNGSPGRIGPAAVLPRVLEHFEADAHEDPSAAWQGFTSTETCTRRPLHRVGGCAPSDKRWDLSPHRCHGHGAGRGPAPHRCPERAHRRRGAYGGCRGHATRRIGGRTGRRAVRRGVGPRGSCARHAPRPAVSAPGISHSLGRHLCSGLPHGGSRGRGRIRTGGPMGRERRSSLLDVPDRGRFTDTAMYAVRCGASAAAQQDPYVEGLTQ